MSTLAEIENAADLLSSEEKEALLRFLAAKLHEERTPLQRQKPSNLAEFAGVLSMAADPLDWQRRMREEWQ